MMNDGDTGVQNAALVATRRGTRVTWHTLRRDRLKAGAGQGLRRHNADALDSARSLEGLIARFDDAEIVYDPTGAFERARRLVTGGRAARKGLGRRLVSLHLLPSGRTVHARVRALADIDHVAPAVGAAFARALSGCTFQIGVTVSLDAPPAGALPLERIGARRDQVMAAAQRLSAALAVAGAAIYGLGGGETASAATTGAGERAMPPASPAAGAARTVRAIYAASGDLLALHLADEDRGGAQDAARRALDAVRGLPLDTLVAASRGEGVVAEGLRFKARRQRMADGVAYAVTVSLDVSDASLASPPADTAQGPVYYPVNAPAAPAPAAPPPAAAAIAPAIATRIDHAEASAQALVRGDQSGGVVAGEIQFKTAPDWAVNLQGAIGTIDGDLAGGAQALAQHVVTIGGTQADVGAFASAVQSTAPSGEDFGIVRVGAGLAATLRGINMIVRGGYAQGTGDLESDGGFARAEGAWFPTPDVALTGFVETDPATGAGAGAGVAFKPFTGAFANLMIDADAAWHEDGEESFRLGVRWLFGRDGASSLRDIRARKGMAPELTDDLRRLPDELTRKDDLLTQQTQPYCGDASDACPTG